MSSRCQEAAWLRSQWLHRTVCRAGGAAVERARGANMQVLIGKQAAPERQAGVPPRPVRLACETTARVFPRPAGVRHRGRGRTCAGCRCVKPGISTSTSASARSAAAAMSSLSAARISCSWPYSQSRVSVATCSRQRHGWGSGGGEQGAAGDGHTRDPAAWSIPAANVWLATLSFCLSVLCATRGGLHGAPRAAAHLVVAAAPGVQLAAGGADELAEPALVGSVDVLVAALDLKAARRPLLGHPAPGLRGRCVMPGSRAHERAQHCGKGEQAAGLTSSAATQLASCGACSGLAPPCRLTWPAPPQSSWPRHQSARPPWPAPWRMPGCPATLGRWAEEAVGQERAGTFLFVQHQKLWLA